MERILWRIRVRILMRRSNMSERSFSRPPRLKQFLDRSPQETDDLFRKQERHFSLMGYESLVDVGFSPELNERSEYAVETIPADLYDGALLAWANERQCMLSERHAYYFLSNQCAALQRPEYVGRTIHFFGTQYRKMGVLYVPVIRGAGKRWYMRLDPLNSRHSAKDVALRVIDSGKNI